MLTVVEAFLEHYHVHDTQHATGNSRQLLKGDRIETPPIQLSGLKKVDADYTPKVP